MKTQPMSHQLEGCARLAAADVFALGAEQGTGKTWMLLADAEARWEAREIEALFVVAPKGVHVNWLRREAPAHLSVPYAGMFWLSGAGKRHTADLEALLKLKAHDTKPLIILTMNVDAVNTSSGYEFAARFLRAFRTMMVVDESQRIKNIAAKRTKKILALGALAALRRIASGTLVANSPLDLFSQYEFLAPGLLGTRSYRAFVGEYADLVPESSPLIQNIVQRTGSRYAPQIVARNADGTPRYKNTDKLARLMAPHTYRVTKDQCLDLPEKIYQTQYFELDQDQMRMYKELKKDRRWITEDGDVDTFTALTIINKLRQVTSGYILVDGEPQELRAAGPRLEALCELVEDTEGPIIVWASFREELRKIAATLRAMGEEVREYHGGTSGPDRDKAIDDFQNGAARIFVANPAAAGTGLTLTAARTAIYYSCSFSLEERLQSEDRCHRIGTSHHVLYIDLVARDTIDEKIAAALQAKKCIAEQILSAI